MTREQFRNQQKVLREQILAHREKNLDKYNGTCGFPCYHELSNGESHENCRYKFNCDMPNCSLCRDYYLKTEDLIFNHFKFDPKEQNLDHQEKNHILPYEGIFDYNELQKMRKQYHSKPDCNYELSVIDMILHQMSKNQICLFSYQ